jgi:amino acid adenylation domain-containing protein
MKAVAELDAVLQLNREIAMNGNGSKNENSLREHEAWVHAIPQALPIERFGTATVSFTMQSVKVRLGRSFSDALNRWAQSTSVEPVTYLLAIWQILIWNLLHRSIHVTGVVLDQVPDASITDAMASPFPLMCNPEPGLSMEKFVIAVQRAIDNQVQRSRSRSTIQAVFTVLFEARRRPGDKQSDAALKPGDRQNSFLLRCRCDSPASGADITIDYDASRIDKQDAVLLARQFKNLSSEALADPNTPVARLTVIDPSRGAPAAPVHLLGSVSVPVLFVEQAKRIPGLQAVVAADGRFTYGELLVKANAVAAYLRQSNVGPDSIVAIVAECSVHTIAAIFGVMLAGGAYAPLDPEAPVAYRAKQIVAGGIQMVLATNTPEANSIPKGVQVVLIDEILSTQRERLSLESHPIEPRSLAYVIHTSGSTGTPKAVGVPHAALASYTAAVGNGLGLKQHSQSSFALACSLAVDLGHTCLFPALTTGGCLHLLGKTLALDAAAFAEYMITNQIDVLKIVPSHLRALLTHGREVLPRRWLILGGEPFSVDLYNRIKEVGGAACGVVNHYGPTETTVGCLMNHVRAHEQILLPPILSIGKPLPGYRSYVLDEAMRPVGINMPGELFIGGTGVARGYLNQPSETAARFVPDPFSSEPGQRLYRTGDLARERRDGRIQVLGRIDDQVKIRGHRVEPAEVEAVIAQHPAVGAAAVLAQVDYNGVPCLIAYLTPRSGVASDTKEVEAAFAAQLPPALLPSLFVWRDRLPLKPNGKVDKQQLQLSTPAPRSATPANTKAPQTRLEKTIADVWKEVLGGAHVGNEANFFELGGDSIGAIRVTALLRQAGVQITPIQLFQHPTPEGLAKVAVPLPNAVPAVNLAVPPTKAPDRYPLTPVQEGLLFHCLSSPGQRLYVSEAGWNFAADFDPESFIKAWQAIVDRHSAFRTAYHWQDREHPIQTVEPELRVQVERLDWSRYGAQEIEERLARYCADIHRTGIDLSIAPLMKLTLLELPGGRYRFVFIYHHLLMDGWSEGILFDELEVLYDDFRHGRESALPRPAPYHEFVEWLQTKDFARTDQFWREYLRGLKKATAIPGDNNLTSISQTPSWGAVDAIMDRGSSDLLRQFTIQNQITLNTLVQAAWGLVLGEYSGEADVMFGAAVAVRPPEVPRLAKTIGLFLNLNPVRIRLAADATVSSWLRELQKMQAMVREYSDIPLLQVQSCSEIPHGKPLFETTVGFQNLSLAPTSYVEGRPPLLPIESVSFRGGWTNYGLSIDVEPRDEIVLTASFDERRVSAKSARQVLESFQSALSMIPAHQINSVSALRQALARWRREQVAHRIRASLQTHRKQLGRVRP